MTKRSRIADAALILAFALTACAHGDPSRATRIHAFRPDGSNATPEMGERDAANIEAHGVVIEFQPGDLLSLDVDLNVEGMELIVETPAQIRLDQRLFVFSGPRGLEVSRDGVDYRPIRDLFDGSVSVGISVAEATQRNALNVAIESDFRL